MEFFPDFFCVSLKTTAGSPRELIGYIKYYFGNLNESFTVQVHIERKCQVYFFYFSNLSIHPHAIDICHCKHFLFAVEFGGSFGL